MSDAIPGTDLSDLVEPLKAKLAEVSAHEEKLRAELADVTADYRRRIREAHVARRQVEKTYNLLTTGRAVDSGPKSSGEAKPVREETVDAVVDALKKHGGNATVPELVHNGLRYNAATIRNALDQARREERVRLAGKRKSRHDNRAHGAKAQAFAPMD